VIAVATVATAALNIVFPPLVVPTLVVAGSAAVVGVSAAIQDQREQRRQQEETQALRREVDEVRRNQQELRAQLTRLQDRYEERVASVVDLDAVRDAQVVHVGVQIEPAA
jgi:TolA-binding protein